MKKRLLFLLVVFIFCTLPDAYASDLRLQSMGGVRISVWDAETQLNLWQYAGNSAWLNKNDSLNWGRYSLNSLNQWGSLHRNWGAEGVHQKFFRFTGQKHISENQIFFGSVQYNHDRLSMVNMAIDPRPYDPDPFVLADSVKGDFIYYGPKITMAFSQRIMSKLFLGISLNYAISEGLKKQFTRPEIIGRYINTSFDLAYQPDSSWVLGVSFRPYDYQDITKLVKQPNGISPVIRRYRGEFEYSKYVSTGDRTAHYRGWEVSPQMSFKNKTIEGALFVGYRYLWQEIYDGTTQRVYDGNYESEQYSIKTAWRYRPRRLEHTVFAFQYALEYLQDWADEPLAGFMIYQSWQRAHHFTAGFSHQFMIKPILLTSELHYDLYNPHKNDYLAHRLRSGLITNIEWHSGIEITGGKNWRIRGGYIYTKYTEDKIWNYFGNYQGPGFTYGFEYIGSGFEIEGTFVFNAFLRSGFRPPDIRIERKHSNAVISFKHFF